MNKRRIPVAALMCVLALGWVAPRVVAAAITRRTIGAQLARSA